MTQDMLCLPCSCRVSGPPPPPPCLLRSNATALFYSLFVWVSPDAPQELDTPTLIRTLLYAVLLRLWVGKFSILLVSVLLMSRSGGGPLKRLPHKKSTARDTNSKLHLVWRWFFFYKRKSKIKTQQFVFDAEMCGKGDTKGPDED